ncbi:hypothetical protein GALMADRAFT_133944 [Galerina marginata CBS 339.88]|uniref:Uncharacterized protein n=1 Tax=Galerina marginata (strain CBS 339.88) TaxID=685588 RepID=A0A067TGE7_GALM3|nr:hypothetical protein GALMADRAFT_133944 [Galerina marginata CBS 339.88]
MPSELKEALKPMLLIEHRQHDVSEPYSVNEISMVAEKYFKRDRFSDLLPGIMGWDQESDSSDSDSESDDESSDSESEAERRHHQKKKKNRKTKEVKTHRKNRPKPEKQGMEVSRSEMDGLVDRINKLTLLNTAQPLQSSAGNQPAYLATMATQAPHQAVPQSYMSFQDNNTQQQSSSQPYTFYSNNNMVPPGAPPMPPQGYPSYPNSAVNPPSNIPQPYRTYPNNIPLPQNQFGGFPQLRDNKCFGCFDPNHYLSNCPRMRELFQQGIVEYDPVTKKYCMKKTREVINRSPRETMYEAALRLNSVMPPAQPQNANYVTFAPEEGQEDTGTLEDSIQQYYASQLNNETETDSDDSDDEGPYWKYALHAEKQRRYYQPSSDYYDSESEDENNAVAYPVTRSMTKRTAEARERANKLPSKPPKMVFDGVYPPRRPRGPPKPKPESAPAPEVPQQTIQQLPTPAPQQAIQPTTISALPQTVSQAPESSRQAVPVPAPS